VEVSVVSETFGFQKRCHSVRVFGTYTYTLTLKKACLNARKRVSAEEEAAAGDVVNGEVVWVRRATRWLRYFSTTAALVLVQTTASIPSVLQDIALSIIQPCLLGGVGYFVYLCTQQPLLYLGFLAVVALLCALYRAIARASLNQHSRLPSVAVPTDAFSGKLRVRSPGSMESAATADGAGCGVLVPGADALVAVDDGLEEDSSESDSSFHIQLSSFGSLPSYSSGNGVALSADSSGNGGHGVALSADSSGHGVALSADSSGRGGSVDGDHRSRRPPSDEASESSGGAPSAELKRAGSPDSSGGSSTGDSGIVTPPERPAPGHEFCPVEVLLNLHPTAVSNREFWELVHGAGHEFSYEEVPEE
jgi:hypothetical protein